MLKGKIIAFEGIDGSGKGTQSKMLYKYFQEQNIPTILFEFPGYTKTFFGKVVGEFLNGDFGDLGQVHPKLAAILYAGDRYEQSQEIRDYLSKGYNVICDRYVPSNIAHQIAKLPIEEQDKMIVWIEHLEYEVFHLPKPNVVFFMNMQPELSSQLVLKKDQRSYTDKKQDIHEADQSYLDKVYIAFQELAKSTNWKTIDCGSINTPKSIDTINQDIVSYLNKSFK